MDKRSPPELVLLLPWPVPVCVIFMSSFLTLAAIAEQQQQLGRPITLPGCPDKCGDISIPFPFGLSNKPGCFLDGYQVTCNDSFHPPRLFLHNTSYHRVGTNRYDSENNFNVSIVNFSTLPVEVMDISAARSEVRAYGLVRSSCVTTDASTGTTYQIRRLQDTSLADQFNLATTRNVLVGIGMSIKVWLTSSLCSQLPETRCPYCASDAYNSLELAKNGTCSGIGCCQLPVTKAFDPDPSFDVDFTWDEDWDHGFLSTYPCSYGMVVESSWYNFSTEDLVGYDVLPSKHPRGVPFVIDFGIWNGSCPVAGGPPPTAGYACLSGNSSCVNASNVYHSEGHVCKCLEHYDGNPYIPNGCQDIDECALPDQYPCSSGGVCVNRIGGYDCPCKLGMRGDGKTGTCTEQFPLPAKIVVGAIGVVLVASVVVFLVLLRREKRRMKEYFDKNGGPILEKVSDIKIFKNEKLKPILKSKNIVGKGAFGEVYKGLLEGRQVAVKKPAANVDAAHKEQFTNELIIQSRIIHKNIVKLIGCCVEVDVPILVYEFISKGSLDDILHGDSKKEPLDLDQRLRIAAESAEGLAYMHSKTTTDTAVLHGDVKPANILLNDELVPKISDFGISRLIAIDKAQTTDYVIGDLTYMDPVYRQTGDLTEKSDVYSFGIVLLELISRKKAIYADNNNLLVTSFLDAHKKPSGTTELFDKEITTETNIGLLERLAGIAVECLKNEVAQRPQMTDVAERLLMLRRISRDI